MCCAPRIKEHRYPGAHCLCRKGLVPGPHCGLGLPPRVEEVPCGVFCVPVGRWQRLWGTLLPPTHMETGGMIACEGKADLGGLACKAWGPL